jgi:hypothetical protein
MKYEDRTSACIQVVKFVQETYTNAAIIFVLKNESVAKPIWFWSLKGSDDGVL